MSHAGEVDARTIAAKLRIAPALRHPGGLVQCHECPMVAVDVCHAFEVDARAIAATLLISPTLCHLCNPVQRHEGELVAKNIGHILEIYIGTRATIILVTPAQCGSNSQPKRNANNAQPFHREWLKPNAHCAGSG